MNTERSAILSLLAMGRITPREAEQLLAAWGEGDDTILRLALCLAFAGLALPYVGSGVALAGQTLATLLPAIERALFMISGMA